MISKKKKQKPKEQREYYSSEMVAYQIDDMDTISMAIRGPLFGALSLLPHNVIDFMADEYTFICPDPNNDLAEHWRFDAMAFKKKMENMLKTGFILVNPLLWEKEKIQIDFTIAHEVAHAFLGHKKVEIEDTSAEIGREQEISADKQAVKWLRYHYQEKRLIALTYRGTGIIK